MQRGCLGARALGDGAVCVCACVYVCSVGTSTLSSGSSRSRHPLFFGTPSLRSPLPPTSASSASACPSASRRWSSGEASTCRLLRGDPAGRRGWLCRSLPPTLCRPPRDQLRSGTCMAASVSLHVPVSASCRGVAVSCAQTRSC